MRAVETTSSLILLVALVGQFGCKDIDFFDHR